MSENWVNDIEDMHHKFGVHEWMDKNKDNKELMRKFLSFRMKFLIEELNETEIKGVMDKCPEEIVDGCIDLCVVAIGTLDAFGVDAQVAWDQVHNANMAKVPGVKPSRPNPLGLPDLIKPDGWQGPSHKDNYGLLPNSF